ncbi:MAG: hypothetical protein LBT59_05265 [Clostridiales bacterium]|jgi:hypothetical protein|nr:hypothetical protein [Clostridiales bacterium]
MIKVESNNGENPRVVLLEYTDLSRATYSSRMTYMQGYAGVYWTRAAGFVDRSCGQVGLRKPDYGLNRQFVIDE